MFTDQETQKTRREIHSRWSACCERFLIRERRIFSRPPCGAAQRRAQVRHRDCECADRRLTEDARISTVSGDAVIRNHYGDLQLKAVHSEKAVHGEKAVHDHQGRIVAHTITCDLTASGEIMSLTREGIIPQHVHRHPGIPDLVRINTVSGDVTTCLEQGVLMQYKIVTVSGRLQLDDSDLRGMRGGYAGTFGRFGRLEKYRLESRANTVSGDIFVLHEASASIPRSSPTGPCGTTLSASTRRSRCLAGNSSRRSRLGSAALTVPSVRTI